MDLLNKYTIQEKIAETPQSTVYRCRREDESATVIIKVLRTSNPTVSEIARFRQEYEIIRSLDFDGIVKVRELLESEGTIGIVLEDFDGRALIDLIREADHLDLPSFLAYAHKTAEALGYLHAQKIVHRDIKPHNILVNRQSGAVKITDFGIADELTHESAGIYNPNLIEGTIPYLSPEQTGRMNRAVDYRTDLYSLGIVFYEMLTGTVPFKSKDPLEIIHAHIAREPVAPDKLNVSIPRMVSAIIMKLLAKMAEDRYQNAYGLAHDLALCGGMLARGGEIQDFTIGERDISLRFSIPQILVGRDRELGILLSSFEEVAGGNREVVMVGGDPGIGKSSLINEIQKPITEKHGYFIAGKFDQYRREVPYSAIIQAFLVLIKQILTESDERISGWRRSILDAVGSVGKVLTDVIPELALIIGEQEEVSQLGPEESQNRFTIVFRNFARVFANAGHPLVIFLDDLQWADFASCNYIASLAGDPDITHLLLVGAFRKNEIDESHPLTQSLIEMRKSGVTVRDIALGPLSPEDTGAFLSQCIRHERDKIIPLTELVFSKTGGNPFFINQFLKTIHDEQALILDPVSGWQWDLERIRNMRVTDNVVTLMTQKIAQLPAQTIAVLKHGACIGNRFDLEFLSAVMDRPVDAVLLDMNHAIDEGFLIRAGDLYRFQHDRIQEAAYLLIPDEDKTGLHHRIGTLLLEKATEADLSDKIFFIVDHLNRAAALFAAGDERVSLAGLNLRAAKKARASAAYIQAFNYLKTGIELVGPEGWENRYELTLELYQLSVEAAFLNNDYNEMDRLIEQTLRNSRSVMDSIPVQEIQLQAFQAQNKLKETINATYRILSLLKIRVPRKYSLLKALLGMLKIRLLLRGKSDEYLLGMPRNEDPRSLAAIAVVTSASSSFYLAGYNKEELLIIFKVMELSLRHGLGEQCVLWFAYYSLALISMGDIDQGFRFGSIALQLVERLNARRIKSRVIHSVNEFTWHWNKPLAETLEPLLQGYQAGLENGDFESACFNAIVYCFHAFFAGKPLHDVNRELLHYESVMRKFRQITILHYAQLYRQAVLNLLGDAENPCRLQGDSYDAGRMEQVHRESKDSTALFFLHLNELILGYIFCDHAGAARSARAAKKYLRFVPAMYPFTVFYFYRSLNRLALLDGVPPSRRKKALKKIVFAQKKIRGWAQRSPFNHRHKYDLIEAEIARIRGDHDRAAELYDAAIEGACENGFLQDEALAAEIACRFYLAKKRTAIARFFLHRSLRCYRAWGAEAKVRDLEGKYPSLVLNNAGSADRSFDTKTSTTLSDALDFSSIIKSAQAIASETDLDALLRVSMKLALENSGAQRGVFIMKDESDGMLRRGIQAFADGSVARLEEIPGGENQIFPSSIMNYVNKTLANAIINDASQDARFRNDPYLRKQGCKSVLCTPIRYRRKVMGIIYLENNLTTNAFTPERLQVLQILSSQAAIAIENARLITHRETAAKLSREMEIAANIQTTLLPREIALPGYEIAAFMQPADEVGGDYYDILKAGDRDWILIGDVSGHGVPAGLVMLMVQTAVRTTLHQNPGFTPTQLLATVDHTITENIQLMHEDKYMTITAFVSDGDGRFSFSGLHQNILVYRGSTGTVDVLETNGTWLGLALCWDDTMEGRVELGVNDCMLLFSDGVTEATRKSIGGSGVDAGAGRYSMFGEEQLIAVLTSHGSLDPESIRGKIMEALVGYELVDDITLLIVKRVR